jgi:AcrR family transcriptional regulator
MEQIDVHGTGAPTSNGTSAPSTSTAAAATSRVGPSHRRRSVRTRNGLTPEQRREQRRQALLDAALELFGTKGYTSTSVEEICRTAFVSTRNFYEEFENREALLWNLVYQTLAEAYDALRGRPGENGHRPAEAELHDRISRMAHAFLDDPRRARLVFVECRGMSLIQEYRRRAAQQAFAQLLGELIDDRMANIAIGDRARSILSLAVVGGVDLILSDWVLQEERPTVDELIDAIVEVVAWMGGAFLRATC